MAFLPRTAISLFGFVVFAGWLIAQIFSTTTSLQAEQDSLTASQQALANATTQLTSTNQSSPTLLDVFTKFSSVFEIIYNVLLIIFNLFATVFSSVAGFLTVITGLPATISQIFIVVLLLGSIFVLIKVIIPEQ